MTVTDPIADMLTRIRNAQMRHKSTVRCPASKLRGWILDVLAQEGYIRGYKRVESDDNKPDFDIELRYFEGAGAIREIKRISRPGRRYYTPARDIPHIRNGLGICIVSTPLGIMSDHKARERNVGGEVLCSVF